MKTVYGLFVRLRSRERKVHRWYFRSHGTLAPWNFRSCETFVAREQTFQELSLPGTFAPVELLLLRSEMF